MNQRECDRDDHVPPRQLRWNTASLAEELFLNLDLPPPPWQCTAVSGGVSIRFGCIGRAVLPIDYTWLVEQIELQTGRAKPLPVSAEPAVMGSLPTAREWAPAFDVGGSASVVQLSEIGDEDRCLSTPHRAVWGPAGSLAAGSRAQSGLACPSLEVVFVRHIAADSRRSAADAGACCGNSAAVRSVRFPSGRRHRCREPHHRGQPVRDQGAL